MMGENYSVVMVEEHQTKGGKVTQAPKMDVCVSLQRPEFSSTAMACRTQRPGGLKVVAGATYSGNEPLAQFWLSRQQTMASKGSLSFFPKGKRLHVITIPHETGKKRKGWPDHSTNQPLLL